MSHENRLNMAGLTADEILAINSVLARDAVLRKKEDKRVKWLKFKTIGRNIHFAFMVFLVNRIFSNYLSFFYNLLHTPRFNLYIPDHWDVEFVQFP